MALAGGHPDVPFHHQGLTLLCWLKALEMLMSYRYGSRYGRTYQKAMGGPVLWGAPRTGHTPHGIKKCRLLGMRIERGSLTCGSRFVDHAVDYGLRPVDKHQRAVLLVGWNRKGKIAYQDPLFGNSLSKYSYCSVDELVERTKSVGSVFWRSL